MVESLKKLGAIFVEELNEIKDKTRPVIFSAHGVPKSVPIEAKEKNFFYLDATCPLVTKVHKEAEFLYRNGYKVLLIGHKDHPEVLGTMGQLPTGSIKLIETTEDAIKLEINEPKNSVAYVTQTTLSVDDANRIIDRLKVKFPNIVSPPKEDICYATQNRQEAVRLLSQEADVVLVLGSQNSSNSQRLKELAMEHRIQAYLIDEAADIDTAWFTGDETVVVTAGASAPESVVAECVDFLRCKFDSEVENRIIRDEEVHFSLPKELRVLAT